MKKNVAIYFSELMQNFKTSYKRFRKKDDDDLFNNNPYVIL
jgi:hypothetical protein